MVQGGMKCIKYVLFIFNFLFVGIGIALVAIGVSTKTGFSRHLKFIDPEILEYPPNLFIVAGITIFIIAFLGCYGSWKESHCMMITYSVLLAILLILELAAAFSAFALQDDTERIFVAGMRDSQLKYGNDTTDLGQEITKSWDTMQRELKCCGTKNFTDWKVNSILVENNTIPISCCRNESDGCSKGINFKTPVIVAEMKIYVNGCWEEALKEITLETIGIVGLVLAIVELLGIISACFMARSIRHNYETV